MNMNELNSNFRGVKAIYIANIGCKTFITFGVIFKIAIKKTILFRVKFIAVWNFMTPNPFLIGRVDVEGGNMIKDALDPNENVTYYNTCIMT